MSMNRTALQALKSHPWVEIVHDEKPAENSLLVVELHYGRSRPGHPGRHVFGAASEAEALRKVRDSVPCRCEECQEKAVLPPEGPYEPGARVVVLRGTTDRGTSCAGRTGTFGKKCGVAFRDHCRVILDLAPRERKQKIVMLPLADIELVPDRGAKAGG